MSALFKNPLVSKGLMVVFGVMLMLGLATALAPTSHAATYQTNVASDVPSVEIHVHCGTSIFGHGIMDHVYVSGNNQHNVWSQWWGSSANGYDATTYNWWWHGYTYIQWRLYGSQENHAYYWVDPNNGNPAWVNVC